MNAVVILSAHFFLPTYIMQSAPVAPELPSELHNYMKLRMRVTAEMRHELIGLIEK